MDEQKIAEFEDICAKIIRLWAYTCIAIGNDKTECEKKLNSVCEGVNTRFIPQVITKKLAWAGINVKVPDTVLLLLEIWSNGNPGIAQIMMKEILQNSRIKDANTLYELTPQDAALAFELCPLLINPIIEKEYNAKWDAQKDSNGDNLCDTKEWWQEVYNGKNS